MKEPEIIKGFVFQDESRGQRWPDEWFDGQQRVLTPEHLRIASKVPASPEGKKQLRMRRQSLHDTCKRRGLSARFNWKGTSLVMQVVGKLQTKATQPPPPAPKLDLSNWSKKSDGADGPQVAKAKKVSKRNGRK